MIFVVDGPLTMFTKLIANFVPCEKEGKILAMKAC
jgi:hypothetical protein